MFTKLNSKIQVYNTIQGKAKHLTKYIYKNNKNWTVKYVFSLKIILVFMNIGI